MSTTADSRAAAPPLTGRTLRRSVTAVRRFLGAGPYLHVGCGHGALLARLAVRGSASGVEPDPVAASAARLAAPGCPVHDDAAVVPAGIFRGVLADVAVLDRPDAAAQLAAFRRALVPGGRLLLLVAEPDAAAVPRWRGVLAGAGFAVWFTGDPRRVPVPRGGPEVLFAAVRPGPPAGTA